MPDAKAPRGAAECRSWRSKRLNNTHLLVIYRAQRVIGIPAGYLACSRKSLFTFWRAARQKPLKNPPFTGEVLDSHSTRTRPECSGHIQCETAYGQLVLCFAKTAAKSLSSSATHEGVNAEDTNHKSKCQTRHHSLRWLTPPTPQHTAIADQRRSP